MRASAFALVAVALAACQQPAGVGTGTRTAAGTGAGTGTGTGTGAGTGTATAIAAVADPYERRRQRPVIIGGCDAACATPEAAVQALFAALQAPDRVASLRPFVEWSLLVVDGVALGERWADLWGDPARHPERDASIDAWLQAWSGWVDRMETPADFAKATATLGIHRYLGMDNSGRPDRPTPQFEVRFLHPKLRDGGGEAAWELVWTRRGYEWLLSSIDHEPERRRSP